MTEGIDSTTEVFNLEETAEGRAQRFAAECVELEAKNRELQDTLTELTRIRVRSTGFNDQQQTRSEAVKIAALQLRTTGGAMLATTGSPGEVDDIIRLAYYIDTGFDLQFPTPPEIETQ
jgi:hypothetical protein